MTLGSKHNEVSQSSTLIIGTRLRKAGFSVEECAAIIGAVELVDVALLTKEYGNFSVRALNKLRETIPKGV